MAEGVPLDMARDALERHRDALTTAHRAVGTGLGKRRPTDSGYVITVYLADAADRPTGEVSVDGVPLQFVVTGTFRAS